MSQKCVTLKITPSARGLYGSFGRLQLLKTIHHFFMRVRKIFADFCFHNGHVPSHLVKQYGVGLVRSVSGSQQLKSKSVSVLARQAQAPEC